MGKKWNPDAKPAEKLLALYTMLLFSGREASLSDLSRELNCSKQAVTRLMDQLEASRFGKLLRSKRGREAIYQLDRPRHLPKISLNADGLYQLALCRDFILHLLPDAMRKNVAATLQQASAFLPEGAVGDFTTTIGQVFTKGRINYTPFQDMLDTLIRGIRERKICIVSYKSALHKETREFEYAPKRIIAYHEAIHLTGWVVTGKGAVQAVHETPTTLALHRLQKVSFTRRDAQRLPEPEEENQDAFGLMEDEPFTARIRFDQSAATYVAEREWSVGQKIVPHKDGGVTLTVTVRSPAELIAWILSFGDAAEVLSPKWLQEKTALKIQAMENRYKIKSLFDA
jgi:predicted DNA-binding transcriptional regulator YafY